jgi:hypothetical protein
VVLVGCGPADTARGLLGAGVGDTPYELTGAVCGGTEGWSSGIGTLAGCRVPGVGNAAGAGAMLADVGAGEGEIDSDAAGDPGVCAHTGVTALSKTTNGKHRHRIQRTIVLTHSALGKGIHQRNSKTQWLSDFTVEPNATSKPRTSLVTG